MAKVIDPTEIYAVLEVPSYLASKVVVGQIASLSVGGEDYGGVVGRIDPNVKGTTVDVDILLSGSISSARVNMPVSGVIQVGSIGSSLYIERPKNCIENGQIWLYRVVQDGSLAERVNVQLGQMSASFVEVKSGLKKGDRVVLSDLDDEMLSNTISIEL